MLVDIVDLEEEVVDIVDHHRDILKRKWRRRRRKKKIVKTMKSIPVTCMVIVNGRVLLRGMMHLRSLLTVATVKTKKRIHRMTRESILNCIPIFRDVVDL
jgi:hypothetical protein